MCIRDSHGTDVYGTNVVGADAKPVPTRRSDVGHATESRARAVSARGGRTEVDARRRRQRQSRERSIRGSLLEVVLDVKTDWF